MKKQENGRAPVKWAHRDVHRWPPHPGWETGDVWVTVTRLGLFVWSWERFVWVSQYHGQVKGKGFWWPDSYGVAIGRHFAQVRAQNAKSKSDRVSLW